MEYSRHTGLLDGINCTHDEERMDVKIGKLVSWILMWDFVP